MKGKRVKERERERRQVSGGQERESGRLVMMQRRVRGGNVSGVMERGMKRRRRRKRKLKAEWRRR